MNNYIYKGTAKWLYSWYEQNGVKRIQKKLVEEPTKFQDKAIPRPVPPSRAQNVIRRSVIKSKPSHVPDFLSAQQPVAQPSFESGKKDPGNLPKELKKHPDMMHRPPQPPPKPVKLPELVNGNGASVTKFEYLYGIKHLEVKHTQYHNKSVYVSKPVNVEGNVMSVSLKATEEHPLFDELNGAAADRQTSVEYYIASVGVNPSPTLEDWLPILPEDVRTVRSELLIFGTARTAALRFPALIGSKEPGVVYRNGLKLKDHEWSFADGGFNLQLLTEKDPTAIYSIDYVPNAEFYNPWSLDVNQQDAQPIKHVQEFPGGTNHNKTIVLDKYPYIDYAKINTTPAFDPNQGAYVPMKIRLKDAGIYGSNRTSYKEVLPYDNGLTQLVYTKNQTNYKTGVEKPLRPYKLGTDAYNAFEYRQQGNRLYFTETFNQAHTHTNEEESHGNATIVAEYEYLSSDFRMKIIFRRNSTDENTLTPLVDEYILKFKVMK